ncbi:MAG: RagB/SusD family nutrient uptake outer membrane protein [Prevotellaceae bacterium]|jgi:hypothetical protein|nr:RagB/SusD family nutrient uptake outer membrane protein [Prevotellaceae bacterium]
MKAIRSALMLTLLLSAAFSCEKYVDNPLRGVQTLDSYFQTGEECQSFVTDLYQRLLIHDGWWPLQASFIANEMATDDAWMGNTQQASGYTEMAFYTITPTNVQVFGTLYPARFENISNCNHAITGIPKAPLGAAEISSLVAQAKFCRAYNYLELVCSFGGVPLVLAPISTSEMTLERAGKDEVYEQIFADLKAAAAALEYQTAAQAQGKTSKAACQALLARAYLFRGNAEKGDYENAYRYADSVIRCGIYSLTPNFFDIWSAYEDKHNGPGSIFELQTASVNGYSVGMELSTLTGGRGEKASGFPSGSADDVMDGWGWCVPTSDLENCFLSEGDSIRRKSTIAKYDEPVYRDEELNPRYYFDPSINKSQRVIRKYYIPIDVRRKLIDKRGDAPLNIPLLRLAEMYLTRAEAGWYANKPAAEIAADVNIVRERAKLNPKNGLTGFDLLYAIWKERRMELAFEGLRLYDIRRQVDPATQKTVIEGLMGPNGSFVKYNTQTSTDAAELGNLVERQDKGALFEAPKNLLWPIPQSEIDRSMGTVKQNPGYN